MSLEIQQSELGQHKLIKLIGRLDTETSPDFELAAYDARNSGAREFVVDLSEVSYVSSAGLRVLLALAKALEGQGSMKLTGLKGVVKEVFDKSGFARLFSIFADVQSATGAAPVKIAAPSSGANDAARLLGVNAQAPRPAATAAPSTTRGSAAPKPGFFAKLLAMLGIGKK